MSIVDRLKSSIESRVLVQLRREGLDQDATILGYVVAIGPAFVLFAIVDPNIRFNGFSVMRTKDVTKLESPHKHAAFVEHALALRGDNRATDPNIDMSSLLEIVRTAAIHASLITIHREAVDPAVCHIGKLVTVNETEVTLHEIDCDANWDDNWDKYKLSEITRVDFGGDYENALWIVTNAT